MSLIKTCALYVRVSTEEQTENYSISEQIERLKAYCKAKDLSVTKIYTDGGYSGSNMNRPGLQELIKDVKNYSSVAVYKLDRLSRSQKDTLYLIEDVFLKNKIEFISLTENLNTETAFGRAMIGILSAFAQLEREQIKERMALGREGRAKQGKHHGSGNPPTGYIYKNDRLVIDEIEAEQVRQIFDMFLKGYSSNKIQKIANENFVNKYGSFSTVSSINRILSNPIYTGVIVQDDKVYPAIHEPIISKETFYTVQKLFKLKKNNLTDVQKRAFKRSQMLSGLLVCGYCGARLFYTRGRYNCYSVVRVTKKLIKDKNCPCKKWNTEILDNLISDEIKSIKFDSDYFNNISNESISIKNNTNEIKSKLHNLDEQINRLIALYQFDTIPIEQLNDKIKKIQMDKEKLKNMMDIDNSKIASTESLINKLENLSVLKYGSVSEKNLFLRTIIDYITVYNDHFDIHWNIE